jgi:hypothetical protein
MIVGRCMMWGWGMMCFFDVKKGVLLGVSNFNFETTRMRPMLYERNIVSVSLETK